MNDLYSTYNLFDKEVNGEVRTVFSQLLDFLESRIRIEMGQLSMEALTQSVYFFCKFRHGTPDFWKQAEAALSKQCLNMDISQLSRCLLALAMNQRPVEKLATHLLSSMLKKLEKASAQDLYRITVALGSDIVQTDVLSSDWYFGLYLRLLMVYQELDLNQIQLIATFLSGPDAAKHIPDEFWSVTLVKFLTEALEDFKNMDGELDEGSFLKDFVAALVPLAIRGVYSEGLLNSV